MAAADALLEPGSDARDAGLAARLVAAAGRLLCAACEAAGEEGAQLRDASEAFVCRTAAVLEGCADGSESGGSMQAGGWGEWGTACGRKAQDGLVRVSDALCDMLCAWAWLMRQRCSVDAAGGALAWCRDALMRLAHAAERFVQQECGWDARTPALRVVRAAGCLLREALGAADSGLQAESAAQLQGALARCQAAAGELPSELQPWPPAEAARAVAGPASRDGAESEDGDEELPLDLLEGFGDAAPRVWPAASTDYAESDG